MAQRLLAVRGVSKTFPGVKALDNVSLTVDSGEVVALLGHNGSGKSTLIKVLAGVHKPDPGGDIQLGGDDPTGASSLHFIHQDLGLIPMLSTLENIDLGRHRGTGAFGPVNRRGERTRAFELIGQFGAHFDVQAPVSSLTPAERTIVAIARALDGWTSPNNVLILDEPTAALHGEEADTLFAVIADVVDRGAGVIYISHRLDEVVRIAHRVVVLRDGRCIADQARGTFDHAGLVQLIAGRELTADAADEATPTGPVRLTVQGVRSATLNGVELTVHAGEIVGISGLVGSGMEQLAGVVFGALPRAAGDVHVDGRAVPPNSPRAAIEAGLGFVPADRRGHGAIVTMSATENLTLPRMRPLLRAAGRLDRRAERREAEHWMRETQVQPAQPERVFALFSGGNQQKVVLAKWLRLVPKVLLLQEPTQGVDVGAKAGIYALIRGAALAGAGVLVASSDTKELADLCDRVVVLREGVVAADVRRPQLTESALVRAVLAAPLDPSSLPLAGVAS